MKKIFIMALALVSLTLVPVLAESTFGAGVVVGTTTGVALDYRVNGFDIMAQLGWDSFSVDPPAFGASAALSYRIVTLAKGHSIEVPLSLGLGMDAAVNTDGEWELAANLPITCSYALEKLPMTLFVRLSPGVRFMKDSESTAAFSLKATAGALWCF